VADTISKDVRCAACGYNLRGLPTGSACPECGRAIDPELVARAPTLVERRWLSGLSRVVFALAWISAAAAALRVLWTYEYLRVTLLGSLPSVPLGAWFGHLEAALVVIELAAIWWLTAAPPAEIDSDVQHSQRVWLRFIATWGCIGFLVVHFMRWSVSADVIRIWSILVDVLAAVEVALFWGYLRGRVKRIGDERLAGRCDSIRTGLIVGILAGSLLGVLLHNQYGIDRGTRTFAPMPGRLVLTVFKVWAPLVLLGIGRAASTVSGAE
jgi:hypothetical protein